MKQKQSWLSQWLENRHPIPSPPAPSTAVGLTHTVLTLDKHVQCLPEENPVVLKATWPGEVAGRIVYCNINFCLIIDASEEWKKDTNYSVALFFHFPPPDPRGVGGSLWSLTLVEFCVIGRKAKNCLSKSGPWEDWPAEEMSLLGEMEAARKNKKSPMIGKDAMVCVSQVKDLTHPGSAVAGWRRDRRQRLLSTPKRLGPGT